MIPSNSYPEAPAKVRVINLQDQLQHTVKTVHEAGTIHIAISEEYFSADCSTTEKELFTTDILPIHLLTSLDAAQTLEQADTVYTANLILTGFFTGFGQYGPVACEAD